MEPPTRTGVMFDIPLLIVLLSKFLKHSEIVSNFVYAHQSTMVLEMRSKLMLILHLQAF